MIESARNLPLPGLHPRSRLLSEYIDHDLQPRRQKRIERHLRRCSRCRELVDSLTRTVHALGSMQTTTRPGLAQSVIAALRTDGPTPRSPSGRSARGGRSARLLLIQGSGESAPARRRRALARLSYAGRLRLTLPIALLVGAAITLLNQSQMIFAGRIDLEMCAVCALNFVIPFLALNVGLLLAMGATRRRGL